MIETKHDCVRWSISINGTWRCVECQQPTKPGTAESENANG